MTNKKFLKGVTHSSEDIVQLLLTLLEETHSAYCVIGGLAVNAYAEPVVSLDLYLVVVADRIDALRSAAVGRGMKVQEVEHSLNLSAAGSDLRIQVQTDPRYQEFISRAKQSNVLGYEMNVACLKDVLRGKLWAYSDTGRRASKRQKDMADILRLAETHPDIKSEIPPDIADKIQQSSD